MAMIEGPSASVPQISLSAEHGSSDRACGGSVDREDQDDEQDVGALEQHPAGAEQLLEEMSHSRARQTGGRTGR